MSTALGILTVVAVVILLCRMHAILTFLFSGGRS